MAFDGTHIHLADVTLDDNVRMILPPSANGAAPIVYTYTVSGLGSPYRHGFRWDTYSPCGCLTDNNFV